MFRERMMHILGALGVSAAFGTAAMAVPVFYEESGYLSTASAEDVTPTIGIIATGNDTKGWTSETGGFKIAWEITKETESDPYHYRYWITNENDGDLDMGLSHFILQVSDSFGLGQFVDVNGDQTDLPNQWFLRTDETSDPTRWTEASGNPSLPADMAGIKIDSGAIDNQLQFHFELYSFRDPMDGSFYAKDGKTGGSDSIDIVAYNTGLAGVDDNAFIRVPNTTGTPPGEDEEPPDDNPQDPNGVPEPMTTTLGLMGAMAIISKATGRRNR